MKIIFYSLLTFFLFTSEISFSQLKSISGIVTDQKTGEPLSGATVVEKGTNKGVSTDLRGHFEIQVISLNTTLEVSFINYIDQNIDANGKSIINIKLIPEVASLDEVVVIGYGTQKKVNLTGAVAVIKGDEISERTFSNSSKAIQGLSPGVTVIDRGGPPGQDDARINIRGVGTLGNANPLILVDNVPVNSINDVRPTDIANISVLKDAASAAIYGSRAANGVILITTKRGKEGKMAINYNAYVAMQHTTRLPEAVGIKDYMEIINEGYTNSGLNPKYNDDYIAKTLSGEDPIKYPNTDWLAIIFKPAIQTNHSLNINGGSERSTYALSLNYLDQNGIVKNVNSKNFGLRLNNDFKLSKRITLGTDVAYNRKNNTQPYNIGDVYWALYSENAPTVASQYPDGSYGINSGNRSPLGAINASGYQNSFTDNIFLNLKGQYSILDGLTLQANYAANLYKTSNKNHRNDYVFRDYYTKNEISRYNSYLYYQQGNNTETNARLILDYKKKLGIHDLGALIGVEQTIHKEDQVNASRSFFYSNDLQELSLGDPTTKDNNSASSEWDLQSLFGRINYSFLSKYLVEANFRYDGSSRFAAGRRYGFFPSFSAGWILSKEKFMEPISFLNNLKIRASWGELGNQNIGLYRYQQTIALQQNYTFGGQLVNGAAVNDLANQFITWETSTSSNIGMDADFLNGKLGFTADVFKKRTKNILLTLDIPYTIGLNPPTQNAGIVDNNGIEISAYYRNRINDFKYSVNLNFASITNKVVSLAGTGPYISETSIIKEGVSMNAIFGYEAIGLFKTQGELDKYAKFNAKTTLGSVKYKDQNNDGKIDNDDKVVLGPVIPKYTFGGEINLEYKGIFFQAFVQGAADVYSMPRGGIFDGPYWGSFVTTDWLDRWTPTNPNGKFPSVYYQGSSPNLQPSSFTIQDVSYVRLKNIQLGYVLPLKMIERLKVANVRIYVSGTNLLTFTRAKYVDPELASGRYDSYPQIKMYSFGTNITF